MLLFYLSLILVIHLILQYIQSKDINSSFNERLIIFLKTGNSSLMHKNIVIVWLYLKILNYNFKLHQFSSVAQSCPTLCDPMNRSTPGLPVHHQLPEFTQTHVHQVSDAIQPSHPLSSPSLAPSPSSIRVFSNESTLRMRWPKYWSFSFSIIPSKEIPGLIKLHKWSLSWVMVIYRETGDCYTVT